MKVSGGRRNKSELGGITIKIIQNEIYRLLKKQTCTECL